MKDQQCPRCQGSGRILRKGVWPTRCPDCAGMGIKSLRIDPQAIDGAAEFALSESHRHLAEACMNIIQE